MLRFVLVLVFTGMCMMPALLGTGTAHATSIINETGATILLDSNFNEAAGASPATWSGPATNVCDGNGLYVMLGGTSNGDPGASQMNTASFFAVGQDTNAITVWEYWVKVPPITGNPPWPSALFEITPWPYDNSADPDRANQWHGWLLGTGANNNGGTNANHLVVGIWTWESYEDTGVTFPTDTLIGLRIIMVPGATTNELRYEYNVAGDWQEYVPTLAANKTQSRVVLDQTQWWTGNQGLNLYNANMSGEGDSLFLDSVRVFTVSQLVPVELSEFVVE